jgi:membrane-associated phospholipid phosphatase
VTPGRPSHTQRPSGAAVLGVAGLVGFVLLAWCLEWLEWQDAWFATHLNAWRACRIDGPMQMLSDAAPFIGAVAPCVAIVIAFARRARPVDVLWLLVLFVVALLLTQGLKINLYRMRPGVPPWNNEGNSYPSGHVANGLIGVVTAVRLLRLRPRRGDVVAVVAAGLFVAATGLARLYLGRHWLSDVVGSLLLGLVFVAATALPPTRRRVVAVAVLALVVSPALYLNEAVGRGVHLASASALDGGPSTDFAEPDARLLVESSPGVTWMPARSLREGGFFRFATRFVALHVRTLHEGRPVLKLVAAPAGPQQAGQCRWIALRVGGRLVGEQPLQRRWRTYSFPMPTLAAGTHTVSLETSEVPPGLALRRLELAGVEGSVLRIVARPRYADLAACPR